MIAIGALAGVADNIVRPLFLRGQANMHPLISLLSIFGGINLFGMIGVFVGPILAAILVSLLDIWPTIGRRVGFLRSPSSPPHNGNGKDHPHELHHAGKS
jgi:predicted PurR-regulated permease PerM